MPFGLGMVRKLAAEGREIYAADDHLLSPGNHSKYLAGRFVYPSPRSDTAGFLAELERIAREYEIDVIVPAFEEVFYISTQLERLSRSAKVFASSFRTLVRLHDKGASNDWSHSSGFRSPRRSWSPPATSCARATDRHQKVFRPRRLLPRRDLLFDQLWPAGRRAGHRRGPPHASLALAGAALPGRGDGLHLQHRSPRPSELPSDVPDPSTAQAQHRHPIRGDRRHRVAEADRADRGRASLHGPDLLRLPGYRRRPDLRGVQPARHRRGCC
jgi:hypothetical protein